MSDINISVINWNSSASQPGYGKEIITTDTLRELCAQMDQQAFYSAVVGLVMALLALLYFGRIRPWLQIKMVRDEAPAWAVAFCDKLLLTGIAMCFVIIIVRMLRAG